MLSLKNQFAKSTTLTEPPDPTAQITPITLEPIAISPELDKLLRVQKRYQLETRRRRKRIEEFANRLDLARQDYTRVSQESVGGDLDADEVTVGITAATEKIAALETALKVAEQQLELSEQELKAAGADVQREVTREHQGRLIEKAEKIVPWMDAGAPLFRAYAEQRKIVQGLGDESVNLKITQADLAFLTYLFRVCEQMPGARTGYEAFQSDPKWSLPWSSHLK